MKADFVAPMPENTAKWDVAKPSRRKFRNSHCTKPEAIWGECVDFCSENLKINVLFRTLTAQTRELAY